MKKLYQIEFNNIIYKNLILSAIQESFYNKTNYILGPPGDTIKAPVHVEAGDGMPGERGMMGPRGPPGPPGERGAGGSE